MSVVDGAGRRSTGQLNTGNLNRTPPRPQTPSTTPSRPAETSSQTRVERRQQDRADARAAAKSGIEGMLGHVASEMASSDNAVVKSTGEVLQMVLDSKAQVGNLQDIKQLLKDKGIEPAKIEQLNKAGVISRAFNVAQGAIAASRFLDLAKEAAANPSKLKDGQFLGDLMSQMGKTTEGVLSAMELVSKTPFAAKIPGIAGLIGGVAGIVKDIDSMRDGASASEIVSLIGNATGTLSNAMTVMAPATGGTSLALAAGLKGVSLAMDGVGFVMNNSEKISDWGKSAWNWITGKS
ncbi:hypothetical protein D3C87_703910 [compost metagenome]